MNHQQLALCTLYHGKWWLPALFIDSWVSMHRKHLVSSALWRPLEHLTQSGKWHSDWTLGSILPPPHALFEDSSHLKQIVAFSGGSAEVRIPELIARDWEEAAVTFCQWGWESWLADGLYSKSVFLFFLLYNRNYSCAIKLPLLHQIDRWGVT